MIDKELLELAAKGAGYIGHWTDDGSMMFLDEPYGRRNSDDPWGSLHDDGDCARLEDECCLDIVRCTDSVLVLTPNGRGMREQYADHGYDKSAARRRASTRAAAEIGKAK